MKRNDVISASEIGQYVYCSLSWYLQRCGYKPDSPSLAVGKEAHVDLGRTIDAVRYDIRRSKYLKVIGYLLLICAVIAILYGVSL